MLKYDSNIHFRVFLCKQHDVYEEVIFSSTVYEILRYVPEGKKFIQELCYQYISYTLTSAMTVNAYNILYLISKIQSSVNAQKM
jgi:hypothetical protein